MISDWYDSPGVWDVPYEMPAPIGSGQCPAEATCYSFRAEARNKCVIFHNPYVTQDGHRITGVAVYEDDIWTFSVPWSDIHTGRFVFHVETERKKSVDCGPTT